MTGTGIPGPGEVVADRFRVDRELGRGGFSVVYAATQLNLGRQVAIKMLLPEILGNSYNLQLFRREAQFAKSLRHPYIIEIYDYGETATGLPFIVMELLNGQALGDVLDRQGPLDEFRLWQVTVQTLKALMVAHRQGVVHRDIKPSNIFLCEFLGMADFVKVIDFGIAKALTGPGETTQSSAGMKLTGTPSYMAPEQIQGDNLGPHTDLYALGLVMAEALSGRPVYMMEGSIIDILQRQIGPEPVPLPREVASSRLREVIERATTKSLQGRYRSAAEMLADVERIDFGRINLPSISFSNYTPPRPGDARAPRVGEVIDGRYRLDERLSTRATSAIYRATQVSLERTVALKVMLPDRAHTDTMMDHFRREVQSVRTLVNPHTVHILDCGQTSDGLPFLVSEWVPGLQLGAVLKNVRLLPGQVRQLAQQVLLSLREAHSRGVIHEDLRPSNLYLCDVGMGEDFVKVTDFGRPGGQVTDRDGAVRVAGTDEVLGSPHYMAPEQLLQGHIGPHTDLYALGLVMAEALVGRAVYDAEGDPISVARQVASDAPTPIPERALSGHLGAVIERATRKSLALRYHNAEEMLADLKLVEEAESRESREAGLRVTTAHLKPVSAPMTGGFRAIGRPQRRWGFQTRSHLRGAPVLAPDGTIYVGSFDGALYAIYANGQQRWVFQTQGEIRSAPAIDARGILYVGSRDARVYAINPDGEARWAYETVGPITAAPVVAPDGTVYVGSGDRYIYALSPEGTPRWFVATQGPVSSTPALAHDGTLYVGSEDQHLYAIDPNGSIRWQIKTGGRIYGSPAVDHNNGNIYVGSEDEYLYALNARGRVEWGFEMDFFFASTPVIGHDGTVYIGANDGTLYALSAEGKVLWTFKADDAVVAPPCLDPAGNLYIGANDGKLYAITPEGRLMWTFKANDWIQSTPAIGADGTLYFGADDGVLYAVSDQTHKPL